MSADRGPAWAELERLNQAVATARQRVRDVDTARTEAEANAKAASDQLSAFYRDAEGDADQTQEGKLTTALSKARDAATLPWPERRAGAEAALRARTGERDRYIIDHLEQLLDEFEPEARACAERGEQAIAAIAQCRREWGALFQEVNALLTTARPSQAATLPGQFPLESIWNDSRRIGSVRPPLPQRAKRSDEDPHEPTEHAAQPAATTVFE